MKRLYTLPITTAILAACLATTEAGPFNLHAIFTSPMVLQRDKPITIWGWAETGDRVSVKFGSDEAGATATGDEGRWEVTFPAREASVEPLALVASPGGEKVVNGGWEVSTPETALGFSAIGCYFGSRVQRALQIPSGVISNARCGALIGSVVPAHKFDADPLAKCYAESVAQSRAAFDPRAREALERCDYRRTEEARHAVEIHERIKTLGRNR